MTRSYLPTGLVHPTTPSANLLTFARITLSIPGLQSSGTAFRSRAPIVKLSLCTLLPVRARRVLSTLRLALGVGDTSDPGSLISLRDLPLVTALELSILTAVCTPLSRLRDTLSSLETLVRHRLDRGGRLY